MQAEEAPTKIKGAGELIYCDELLMPWAMQWFSLALILCVFIGLVMLAVGASKGSRRRGIVVYGATSLALVVFLIGSFWTQCGPPFLTLRRLAVISRDSLPFVAGLVGLGAAAWLFGRLVRGKAKAA
ncbi:MAG: hypothetical protein JSR45_08340 [Proteobacteria bacterium]|nr:hypothetical protein [Pseudomonadota bacterium]